MWAVNFLEKDGCFSSVEPKRGKASRRRTEIFAPKQGTRRNQSAQEIKPKGDWYMTRGYFFLKVSTIFTFDHPCLKLFFQTIVRCSYSEYPFEIRAFERSKLPFVEFSHDPKCNIYKCTHIQ